MAYFITILTELFSFFRQTESSQSIFLVESFFAFLDRLNPQSNSGWIFQIYLHDRILFYVPWQTESAVFLPTESFLYLPRQTGSAVWLLEQAENFTQASWKIFSEKYISYSVLLTLLNLIQLYGDFYTGTVLYKVQLWLITGCAEK